MLLGLSMSSSVLVLKTRGNGLVGVFLCRLVWKIDKMVVRLRSQSWVPVGDSAW